MPLPLAKQNSPESKQKQSQLGVIYLRETLFLHLFLLLRNGSSPISWTMRRERINSAYASKPLAKNNKGGACIKRTHAHAHIKAKKKRVIDAKMSRAINKTFHSPSPRLHSERRSALCFRGRRSASAWRETFQTRLFHFPLIVNLARLLSNISLPADGW